MKAGATIGLRRGMVVVRPYDDAWITAYAEEAERLRAALGLYADHLEHVGSTAVPGLAAKPIIDLALGLADWSQLAELTTRLQMTGYSAFGERGRIGDHFFALGPEELRTHYLHVVAWGGDRWDNYLLFRDRLRSDTVLRDTYAKLKTELAAKHSSDRPAYLAAKEQFIARVCAG